MVPLEGSMFYQVLYDKGLRNWETKLYLLRVMPESIYDCTVCPSHPHPKRLCCGFAESGILLHL
jgi:hypothetical protein